MENKPTIQVLWLAAVLVTLGGVGLVLKSAADMNDKAKQLASQVKLIEDLRRLKKDIAPYYEAERKYNKLAGKPVPLQQVIRKRFPDEKPEIRATREEDNIVDGWTLHQVEVAFNETAIDKVLGFLHEPESLNPPWRLSKCDIRASARKEKHGNIVLLFEALEKKD